MKIKIKQRIPLNQNSTSGWSFLVEVSDDGVTSHEVILKKDIWQRLKGSREKPEDLITDSFKFLLERESNQSILRKFNLELIGEYFPEYENEITK